MAQQVDITDRLLTALAARRVTAVGFVNESKLEVDGALDPRQVDLLERWLDAGQELGNHGYAHLSLHRVDPATWLADVLRGERVIRPLVAGRGGELRWFRHPYLHVGRSAEVQRHTADVLAEHGYRIAPVTFDNDEWRYASAYAAAWNQGDAAATRRLGRDYVRYMLEVTDYYESQSLDIAGELIPQVLLVHAYALNADWLGTVLDSLQARGYHFISLDEALAHPAYTRATHGYTGPGGISWLHRWAITAGHDPSIVADQPEAPAWVRELSDAAFSGQ